VYLQVVLGLDAFETGASLGTALIGAVLIGALTTRFVENVEQNPAIPAAVRQQVADATAKGIPVAPVDDVEKAAREASLPPEQAEAVAAAYGDAQLQGLKFAVLAVADFALLSLWFTRRLPGRVAVPEEQAERVPPDLVSAEAP
jgi:hypothetical protein